MRYYYLPRPGSGGLSYGLIYSQRGKMDAFGRVIGIVISLGLPALAGNPAAARPAKPAQPEYDVAAYYFPGFHVEPRNEAYLGAGYTEWSLIKATKPGFDGHFQPRVPAWGYQDEALPAEMEKKIDAAADHGVNTFIFDWYWYDNKPFLERPLNDAYLKARNRDRVKFYLMWANHDWLDIFPVGRVGGGGKIFNGSVDRITFDAVVDYVIKNYFSQPTYYKIDGEPVFSIYELGTLSLGLGGIEATRQALDSFRAKVKAAGFPGLHLNSILWGAIPSSLSDVPGDRTPTQGKTMEILGFSSLTSYTWTHYVAPIGDYIPYANSAVVAWKAYDRDFTTPYYPNVTIGWDTNPRRTTYDPNLVTGNTPNRFADALWKARAYLGRHPDRKKLITINSWNEWPEGSYLEPDTVYRMDYLEAVRDVLVRGWSNVAATSNGGRATASSTYAPQYSETGAFDGERMGLAWGNTSLSGGWNDDTENAFPDWLQVEFNGPKTLGKVEVFTLHPAYENGVSNRPPKPQGASLTTEFTRAGLTDFRVQYWDGKEWKPIPGAVASGNRKIRRQFLFEPIVTSKIRLEVTGAMNGYSRVTEFEAWGRDPLRGCTKPGFTEYDSTAELDNGSCVTTSLDRKVRAVVELDPLILSGSDLVVPTAGPATLGIFDSQGRFVIKAESKTPGAFRIPRSGLRTGIYWMRVEGDMKTVQRKLFVF